MDNTLQEINETISSLETDGLFVEARDLSIAFERVAGYMDDNGKFNPYWKLKMATHEKLDRNRVGNAADIGLYPHS